MTKLTVLTPPGEEPVSLAAVKTYLRIGHDGEDAFLTELLASARARLEQAASLALVTRTVRITWPTWPSELAGRGARLPLSPVTQLDAVRVVDAEASSAMHSERFQLLCGRVRLRPWSMCPPVPASSMGRRNALRFW